jgi:hypothetical protein
MPNPGPNVQLTPNSQQESIVVGSNVIYTFATLPPAASFAPGFLALTSDEGLCVIEVINGVYTWVPIGHGSLTIEAGTNSVSSGTVSFANANGVTFGMNTAGVITATVTPGAAAGIGAIQLPNTTYTSGTVNFINSNGISFGSTTGGGVTASFNGAGTGTTYTGTNVSGTIGLNSAGLALSLSSPTVSGVGISANGSSQTAGNIVFSNANGVSFGMNGSTVTASAAVGGINASLGGNTSGALALISTGTMFLAGGNNVTLSQNGNSVTISANTAAAANLSISAGTTTGAFGGVTFSNSNNLSFGLNNGTITGSVNAPGLGTTFNGANLSGSMTLNSAGLALSLSSPVESGIGLSAAGSSQTSGNIVLSNSNGLSFGMNGSTVTASYNSTQFAGTGTTFAGTNASASMTLNSAGLNLAISAAAGGSGASTGAVYFAGNTTGQSSSSTFAQSSLNISLAGILSGGWSSNSYVISAPNTTGLTQLSAGMSTLGNTAGTTGLASGQLVLAGGNNITLSGSTAANGSMTITISGGAGGGGFDATLAGNTTGTLALISTGTWTLAGGNNITLSQNGNAVTISGGGAGAGSVNFSAGTTSGNLGSVVFSNSNGVSFGLNGSTITASAAAANSTVGLYALGNTTQNSSTTLNQSALSFNGLGEITIGYSNSSIQISAPPSSVGVSNIGNTSGNTGTYSGQVILAGGNNITLSVGTAAGAAQTITVSGANQISTVGLYALGNTTQNSSTTINQSAMSFNALGAMTMGYTNGSIQVSAPATSSISGTGQVSISVNGSTISIGAPNYGTLSYWDNGILNGLPLTTVLGAGSVVLQQMVIDANLSVSALREFISGSFSVTNSSYGNTISVYAGLYTLNASTLSLATSGSQSYGLTNTSNNSASIYSGIKGLTLPLAASMTPGNYWLALMSNTASSGFNYATFNNVVASEGALTYNGILGSNTAGSNQVILGGGYYSATSAALPASIGLSQISGSIGNIAPFVNLYNVTA